MTMQLSAWERAGTVLLVTMWTLIGAGNAEALTLGFACISNNLAGDCAIGEAQATVDVLDIGGNQVEFRFNNAGPDDSSITDVYFDDGSLLAISSVVNGPGTIFNATATPSNLPGANNLSPSFQTSAGFSADSLPPTEPNGANPGESVSIIFDLIGGQTYADVLMELDMLTLRIAIRIQGYTSGGSEGLVNIPEPGTGILTALGLGALAARRRRT